MMKKTITLLGLVATAAFSTTAYADMTLKSQDGALELALPNGWHEGKAEGPLAKLVGTDGRGSRVVVRVLPKEDFKDAKAVGTFTLGRLKLADSEAAKFEDTQVGGKPAVRINVMGTQPSGMRAGYVITVFDSGPIYIAVVASSDASGFTKQAQVLSGFANQLKVSPTATAASKPAK